MRTLWLAALVVTSAAQAAPRKAGKSAAQAPKAGGKTPPACGAHLLPLAVGSTWRYTPVDPHVAIDDKIKRVAPLVPKQIVVTVKSVEPGKGKDGVTTVTLEEKLTYDLTKDQKKPIIDERVVTSTIRCGAKRFDISPESFYFNGEPGGYYGIAFDKLDHVKGTTLVLTAAGGIGTDEWREDLAGHWTRVPSKGVEVNLGSGGKLELERKITPQPADKVQTPVGEFRSEKLGITTTGRVILDTRLQPFTPKPDEGCQYDACIPSNWISTIWIADGVGVVATQNSYGAKFILAEYDLK